MIIPWIELCLLLTTDILQVFKPLVDKVEIFKTKKLPVEFLSDNKLVFQEYSHLRTITVSRTGLMKMIGMMKLTMMVMDFMVKQQ